LSPLKSATTLQRNQPVVIDEEKVTINHIGTEYLAWRVAERTPQITHG
jgi:hypothetical protein